MAKLNVNGFFLSQNIQSFSKKRIKHKRGWDLTFHVRQFVLRWKFYTDDEEQSSEKQKLDFHSGGSSSETWRYG